MSHVGEVATYRCELREQAARPALCMRTTAAVEELPQLMGRVFGEVMQYLGELGEYPAGPPFTAYYNMDMQRLDIEVGFPVSHPLPGRGSLLPVTIPGGTMAVTMHVGPYQALSAAYEALTERVKEQGREPAGVWYEFYLNDPNESPETVPETELVFPLKPV